MARGNHEEFNPNRQVDRGAFARLGRELSKGFPQPDDAPAGGIPRPPMHGCGICNEPTSTDHGVCADCKSKGYK